MLRYWLAHLPKSGSLLHRWRIERSARCWREKVREAEGELLLRIYVESGSFSALPGADRIATLASLRQRHVRIVDRYGALLD